MPTIVDIFDYVIALKQEIIKRDRIIEEINIQLKDINNMMNEADHLNLTLPLVQHIQARFANLVENIDGGDKDHSALYLELLSHNEVKS